MNNSIEREEGAVPASTEIDRAEGIITVGERHLCRDGVAFAEALAETGCNQGTMNFGLILEVYSARNPVAVEGPCPASLSAVSDFAEARNCEWLIIDQEGGGRLDELPVYEEAEAGHVCAACAAGPKAGEGVH